jgi:hypothetical protein
MTLLLEPAKIGGGYPNSCVPGDYGLETTLERALIEWLWPWLSLTTVAGNTEHKFMCSG